MTGNDPRYTLGRAVTIRSLIPALVLLAVTLAAAAQEPDGVPRFFIDTIAVEGVRWASERVIIAETRLHAGREYTEAEIRAGAARAMRLPFVVRIDPRIEKGAQRGAYRLVLAVRETRPLFFGGTYFARESAGDLHQFTTGARRFLGRSGALHGAATKDFEDTLFELGYTQYDLFGSGVFVTATAEYGEEIQGPGIPGSYRAGFADRITAQMVAGVPLRGNHALRATFVSTPVAVLNDEPLARQDPDEQLVIERSTMTELAWIYDSTDDPLFTTRGTRSILSAARREFPAVGPGPDPQSPGVRLPVISFSTTGDMRRVWSIAPRHAVSASASGSYTRYRYGEGQRLHNAYEEASAGGSYHYSIRGPDRPSRFGDLRLETGFFHQYYAADFNGFGLATRRTTFRAGLLFRNEWGVLRFLFDVEHGHE